MFTGIIERVGAVRKVEKFDNYLRIDVSHEFPKSEIRIGESICCDGACLTIVEFDSNTLTFDVSQETLNKTIAGSYPVGSKLNLERALKVGDRLDGHFVTGHVDDTGLIESVKKVGQSTEVSVSFDTRYDKWIVAKGSIAINGVSLTVNEVSSGQFRVNLIPHTIENTNLAMLRKGDAVNLEFDLIGKYAMNKFNVEKTNSLTFEKLAESGW